MQRFRGGLVFKAHRLCVSLNSRLESDKEEEDRRGPRVRFPGLKFREDLGFGVSGFESRVSGLGSRVQGFGVRGKGDLAFRDSRLLFGVSRPGSKSALSTLVIAAFCFYLTECSYQLVLESQLSHKSVNVFFNITDIRIS